MIFCYIDESGTPEIPGNGSHYVLAGLAIPVHHWKRCETEIQKIKDAYHLSDAEIHTGWLIRKYQEQDKIPNFEALSHSARRYEIQQYRNNKLAELKGVPNGKYKDYKKNYNNSKYYTHLTYAERKEFVEKIATLIESWNFCRLFAECIDKTHFNPAIVSLSVDEQAFEQVVSRFEQYLKIYSRTNGDKKRGLLIHDNNETVKQKHTNIMKAIS